MKKQMPPARPKVAPPIPVRHQLEHEVPTVIHHPEENMTALGRLTFPRASGSAEVFDLGSGDPAGRAGVVVVA